MNAFIETLNHWGENFLSFAWPMLWQSSLLIAVVFAFDFFLAKKIRASVRYALWMVVLVKLLLPPTLALPTSATWWLWRPAPVVETPIFKNDTVTTDETAPSDNFVPQTIPMVVPPPPKLNGEAWTLLASAVASTGLLLWLVFRWTRVARKVSRSIKSEAFTESLEETRQLAGLHGQIRLRLIDDTLSPAVYGLFRPVILLPLALMEKLSSQQLRAVLLHEAIHLRRGDVWVNCAQTLLQIAYWWHPLLWLANARIRRVREEAVDDAVMAALCDGADAYAPTLLEVAKFAFRRPLASLGLVGIMESRSALRQRIERLVDFRPPRKAGITFLSLCGIFAFSAVALPMGQGPALTADSSSTDMGKNIVTTSQASVSNHQKKVTIDGQFFWMTSDDLTKITLGTAYHQGQRENVSDWTANAKQLNHIAEFTKVLGLKPFSRPRITITGLKSHKNGYGAELYSGTSTNWVRLECDPYVNDNSITLTFKAESASVSMQAVTNLYEIHGRETVDDNGGIIVSTPDSNNPETNLVVVLDIKATEEAPAAGSASLSNEQKASELRTEGHKFYDQGHFAEAAGDFTSALALEPTNLATSYWLFMATKRDQILNLHLSQFGPYDNVPLRQVVQDLNQKATNAGAVFNIYGGGGSARSSNTLVTLPEMKDVSLTAAFDAIVHGASQPTAYFVENVGGVTFATGPNRYFEMRTFKVDPKTFYSNLQKLIPFQPLARDKDSKLTVADIPYDAVGKDGGLYYDSHPNQVRNVSSLAKQFFSTLNVNLDPPKSVFFNDRLGILFVYATRQDLDIIERAVGELNDPRFKSSWLKPSLAPVSSSTTKLNNTVGDPLAAKPSVSYSVSSSVDATNLEKRAFPLDYEEFITSMRRQFPLEEPLDGFKQLLANAGVDLSPPKTIVLGKDHGRDGLFITATKKDLDTILNVMNDLHYLPPMIHIKARFIEVPKSIFADAARHVSDADITNGTILTNPNFMVLLHEIEQKDAEEVAEPEATTISGRQTQMRAVAIQPIVTNYILGEASTIVPQVGQIETGPILDVFPEVPPGNEQIDLKTIASQIDFWGYADSKNLPPHYATNRIGQIITLPGVLPLFGVREAKLFTTLPDSQTLVLFPQQKETSESTYPDDETTRKLIAERIQKAEEENADKTLVVFVTATLIDAAGNRFHSDDEKPLAQNTDYYDLSPIP